MADGSVEVCASAEEKIRACREALQERRAVLPLDLKRQSLTALPTSVLELRHIQCLYLEGNGIEKLPDDTFFRLPSVRWLDLRNNKLTALPAARAYNQSDLRQLLLEGNYLKKLPNELGDASRLVGLSLHRNPLDYPPRAIVEQGVKAILKFLYNALYEIDEQPLLSEGTPQKTRKRKGEGRSKQTKTSIPKLPSIQPPPTSRLAGPLNGSAAPVTAREVTESADALQRYHHYQQQRDAELAQGKMASRRHPAPPVPAEIQARAEKHKRALLEQSLGRDESDAPNIPAPSPYRIANPRTAYETRSLLEQAQDFKRQQTQDETRLQKQRDKGALQDWRDKRKREQRMMQYRPHNQVNVALPKLSAPFSTDPDGTQLGDDLNAAAAMRQTGKSPTVQQRQDQQVDREKKLQGRIQRHLDRMKQRDSEKLSPRSKLEGARRDLDEALENRKQVLNTGGTPEYRLTAFIATLDHKDEAVTPSEVRRKDAS